MTGIAEIGLAALCLAFLAAMTQALAGLPFGVGERLAMLQSRLAALVFAAMGSAFLALLIAYAASDFSVANVYQNSHTAKPLLYKLTAAWGNHEGSMLLWVLMLCGFAYAISHGAYRAVAEKRAVLAVSGLLIAGFTLFILLTSNPFERLNPPPFEGQDLNPLLQDIGLALHPPLLYLGYVGFAVVFVLAVGALLSRQPIDSAWANNLRPWALLAWAFLTAGIGLGSWWAYRELGWGGWWFWDPVENISLLPWLSGTALLHCLLVLHKRPMLQNWTLLLAIITFTFSLLGTFLVRSGLLTSVHSFASDPERGVYILLFIGLMTGASLWLYALRYPRPSHPDFLPVSREGGILINNLLMVTLCATVFLGILYPILLQIFSLPSISVGAPFYNAVVVPVCIPLLLVAGIAPLLAWKRSSWQASRRLVRHAAMAALLAMAVAAVIWRASLPALAAMPMAAMAALLGCWVLGASVAYARKQYRAHQGRMPISAFGGILGHLGLGIFAVAAAMAAVGRQEAEQRMAVGEKMHFAGHEIHLAALEPSPTANYLQHRATLHITGDGTGSFTLYPETRFYPVRQMETSESAIESTIAGDFYTAIATPADLGNSAKKREVILRAYHIPAIAWIWGGFALTALGGFLSSWAAFRNTL